MRDILKTPQILIIDDDQGICDVFVSYFGKAGFDVTVAKAGYKGISTYLEKDFDVVLVDFHLPDISGYQVIEEIKKVDINAIIVLITGFPSDDTFLKVVKLGALDYVAKPINFKLLLHKLKVLLEVKNHRLHLENKIQDIKKYLAIQSHRLHENESIYRNIFNHISIGISLIDHHMRVVEMNPRMREWHSGVKIEKRPFCFEAYNFPAEKEACDECPVVKCFNDGKSHEFIKKTSTRKGTFYFHVLACPILNKEGEVINVVEIIEDITAQEEEKLEIKKQLKEAQLKLTESPSYGLCKMVGNSLKMHYVYEQIKNFAANDMTVLVQGETGTGKELVAEALHELSQRKDKPFIPIHCGAMPEALLESTLFGHVKGAFTGAISDKNGLFTCADKGTIFLDEIELASLKMQAALLRVLEKKEIVPVGCAFPIKIDVKVVVASNVDLEKMVLENKFREDLFYRITQSSIYLPPLRERKEDIPLLVDYFFSQVLNRKKNAYSMSPNALALLFKYSWPGNIRELKNLIMSLPSITNRSLIRPVNLPDKIRCFEKENSPVLSFNEYEKMGLKNALEYTRNNKAEAARILGVSRRTVYDLIKKHNLAN